MKNITNCWQNGVAVGIIAGNILYLQKNVNQIFIEHENYH